MNFGACSCTSWMRTGLLFLDINNIVANKIFKMCRLPFKLVPNPFCVISLNQVKVARTKVKTGLDPVWDEEFLLE